MSDGGLSPRLYILLPRSTTEGATAEPTPLGATAVRSLGAACWVRVFGYNFIGSLTPCPTPGKSCRRLTCMAIAVIAYDRFCVWWWWHCVYLWGSSGWCCGCEFLGCLGVLGVYSAGRKRGEATLT